MHFDIPGNSICYPSSFSVSDTNISMINWILSSIQNVIADSFQYCKLAKELWNLDLERLSVSKREAGDVHWLNHSLYDVIGSHSNTLLTLAEVSRRTSL